MRAVLENIVKSGETPSHLALAYDAWAPVSPGDGKVPDNDRQAWLGKLADIPVDPDYARFFERWKASFRAEGDRTLEVTLASRLLIGHGNSSATDVGLTVHHTWGVPVIPGTALKGLLAHYVDAVYGPDGQDAADEEQKRRRYRGITWDGRRIRRGPGEVYRALFGAPETDEDDWLRAAGQPAGASAGLVTFHDALYVPGSGIPFAMDVLTVHQKRYYDAHNMPGAQNGPWPNDYDSPNPVSFLTVRPHVRFLLALSGPPDWTALAEHLLLDALATWGIGAKTSAGYGRLTATSAADTRAQVAPPRKTAMPNNGDLVEAVLVERRPNGSWIAKHEPSGLQGPILNSSAVPSEKKVGDRIALVVANRSQRQFRVPAPQQGMQSPQKKR
ncbi:MAG: type III-B CRISPR module RAMP protein Cmr6 [Chloroflexota bacterium]|nr:type III-B CRISPR module RAMP protein Cmr6 [Chloroflexota bacterium]